MSPGERGKPFTTACLLPSVLVTGWLINALGFASPYWVYETFEENGIDRQEWAHGLWLRCISNNASTFTCNTRGKLIVVDGIVIAKEQLPAWFHVVQAFMLSGVITSLLGLIVLFMFSCCTGFKTKKVARIISLVLTLSVLFNAVGVGITAAYWTSIPPLYWAYYLCCAGTILFLLSACLARILSNSPRLAGNLQGSTHVKMHDIST